jgi:hypothetical protein
MKERPILFIAPMVRAILSGAKTQTRRLVREALLSRIPAEPGYIHNGHAFVSHNFGLSVRPMPCPYGVPGDRLWVKETWKSGEYECTDEPQDDDHECDAHCRQTFVYYAATPRVGLRAVPDRARITYLDESTPLTEWYESKWKSPLFMPRKLSRITLEVTSVRVERLQQITDADAIAEGMPHPTEWSLDCSSTPPTRHFRELWDSINRKRCPWASNPWVWAISFKRVTP